MNPFLEFPRHSVLFAVIPYAARVDPDREESGGQVRSSSPEVQCGASYRSRVLDQLRIGVPGRIQARLRGIKQ
jgi:hypothetical protein